MLIIINSYKYFLYIYNIYKMQEGLQLKEAYYNLAEDSAKSFYNKNALMLKALVKEQVCSGPGSRDKD